MEHPEKADDTKNPQHPGVEFIRRELERLPPSVIPQVLVVVLKAAIQKRAFPGKKLSAICVSLVESLGGT